MEDGSGAFKPSNSYLNGYYHLAAIQQQLLNNVSKAPTLSALHLIPFSTVQPDSKPVTSVEAISPKPVAASVSQNHSQSEPRASVDAAPRGAPFFRAKNAAQTLASDSNAPTPPAVVAPSSGGGKSGMERGFLQDDRLLDLPQLPSFAHLRPSTIERQRFLGGAMSPPDPGCGVPAAASTLVLVSKHQTAESQEIFVCSIPGSLKHGQQIHVISSHGQMFSTTVAQLANNNCKEPLLDKSSVHDSSLPPRSMAPMRPNLSPSFMMPNAKTDPVEVNPVALPVKFGSLLGQNTGAKVDDDAGPQNLLLQPTASQMNCCKPVKMEEAVASGGEQRMEEEEVQSPLQEDFSQENGLSISSIAALHFPKGRISTAKSTSPDPAENLSIDGINLEEIKEFAKSFKMKRLSLGLTQTQVGQALSMTEGPAYSQSAICRFEKLDITPKSAQKIKPVLEKWMIEIDDKIRTGQLISEAEGHAAQQLPALLLPSLSCTTDLNFNSPSSTPAGGGPPLALDNSRKRKRRTSFTPQALELLSQFFERNTHPSGTEMTALAESLGYDREVVRVWFCNKRQALKNTIKKLKHVATATTML